MIYIIDLSIASTLCSSSREGSSKTAGYAAATRYKAKMNKYKNIQEKFAPLIMETLGGWEESGLKLMKLIGRRIAENSHQDPHKFICYFMNSVSAILQKFNGQMLASRCLSFD